MMSRFCRKLADACCGITINLNTNANVRLMESAVNLSPSNRFRALTAVARSYTAAAATVMVSTLTLPALANTITFETASLGLGGIASPITENGFTYSTLSGSLFVTPFGNPGHDAEGLQSAGGGVLKIVSATGGNFNFNTLDFAAFASSGIGSQTLTVQGFLGASSVGMDQYTLTNTKIFDPKYGNWTTEAASILGGKEISELRITLSASLGSISNENIDNVVLTPALAQVPEPASLALLGVAVVGASCARLRRRRPSTT
jgi:PEP-CTERM motif